MVLLEGDITVQIKLFEKYRVESVIYESDTSKVYLVEHMFISSRRIIKKISKNSIHRNSFYSEISILKSVKHPSIPIIYDTEEDEEAYYIIEEYMEGISLDKCIKEQGAFDEKRATDFGIKICEIISYLHSQKPIPILFLDIQPKNILIQEDKIYIVDFGNSSYINDTKDRQLLLGTVGYASPEQYTYQELDERADIYGIGAVLYFMVTGRSCGRDSTNSLQFPNTITGKYKLIVLQCLMAYKENRLQSVNAIADNLSDLLKTDNAYSKENKPLIISVVGTQKRIGTTTFGLALAVWLSENGHSTIYEEVNDSNHLRVLAGFNKLTYKHGYFIKDNLMLKPAYGPQVILENHCNYIVRDYGDNYREDESDILVLVAGAKPWEQNVTMAEYEKYSNISIVVSASTNVVEASALWAKLGTVGLNLPYIEDLFVLNDDARKCLNEIFKAVIQEKAGGENNRKKTGFFRKLADKKKNNNYRNHGSY